MMSLLLYNKMGPDSAEMRELAARICRDYLKGPWKNVTAQTMEFKHISGGLSNILYYIALPGVVAGHPTNRRDLQHPKSVLIRVYGPTHGDRGIEHMITESVIFTLLSERGLGPRLYGLFPGGRIEQYINARPLLTKELADEKLTNLIAKKMGAIHTMEVPLHKKPEWLWDTIDRWMKSSERVLLGTVPEHSKNLTAIDFRKEVRWLRKRVEDERCPVVFCHNDLQEGNILIRQDENENTDDNSKLVLIDFEYCSYNYRSYDLANHFLEWTYDYSAEEYPFYKETMDDYPTLQQQLHFIHTYLKETGSDESPEKILREVQVCTMISHFFWCLWSIVNADASVIPFGYWEYGTARLEGYLRTKEQICSTPAVKRKSCELD